MEHPNGEIKVEYTSTGPGVDAAVSLPRGISGALLWEGKSYPVHEGTQSLELPRHSAP
jgi:hypothetical protein